MGAAFVTDLGAPSVVRVVVVADDPLVRGGLAALLNARDDVSVVGQAPPDDTLTEAVEAYQGEVVVWDAGSGADEAADRLGDLSDSLPPIVALLDDAAHASQAWAAGARGLLHRDVTPARLAAALRAVLEGSAVFDDAFAEALVRPPMPVTGGFEPLTPRELQVLRLLAEGHPNKAVAVELRVSENTVKFHVNAILGKLGAQSRTEAVTRAARMGLIPL
jgi:two-component system nitrate/nitrite response regulator NarL